MRKRTTIIQILGECAIGIAQCDGAGVRAQVAELPEPSKPNTMCETAECDAVAVAVCGSVS